MSANELMETEVPTPLTLDDVHEDLRPMYARPVALPASVLGTAAGRWLINAAMKFTLRADTTGVSITTRPTGSTMSRVYLPTEGVRGTGALLFIHGGGFVIGRAAMNDALCCEIVRRLGIAVVSPDYRLAPKHPFPTPVDDCHEAWEWLVAHAAELGVDPERIAVGGQSAGGGLAAMLALRLRTAARVRPSAQWLLCPMLDDRTAANRELDAQGHFGWTNQSNRIGWRSFLATPAGGPAVPLGAVPSRETELEGLPPTWIGVGSIDLFHDEDVAYAEALRAAGVPATVVVVPGAPHGFELAGAEAAVVRNYIDTAVGWLGSSV